MTTNKTVAKTVSYRKCLTDPKTDQSLQQLVSAALSTLPNVESRTEPLDGNSVRVIGKYKNIDSVLCGYLSPFERGGSQPVIADDPKAKDLTLSAVRPPTVKDGKPREFLPGLLYFAIFKNHVAIVQSPTLKSSTLEAHLSWLLKIKTNSIPEQTRIALSDEAQKATKDRIKKSHVKSIGFGQQLMAQVAQKEDTLFEASTKQSNRRFQAKGPGIEFLKQLMNKSAIDELGLNRIFENSLEMWVEIRYAKHTRTKSEHAIGLMDNLAVGLRDVESNQIAIELADGHKISGTQLKVTGQVSATQLAHGLPDENELWIALSHWLGEQIKNGVVSPD